MAVHDRGVGMPGGGLPALLLGKFDGGPAPFTVRIYRTDGHSAAHAEAAFHRLLDAADHSRTRGKSSGREWFLTHTRFLDEIANTLGLHTDIINEGGVGDS
jgi:hypothetical protein